MSRYILRRILWMIPILIGVTILIFTIMFFIPGDPVSAMMSGASRTDMDLAREMLGLNEPYHTRLWHYCTAVFLHFDFGTSWMFGTKVTADLTARFPRTVTLALVSMFFSVVMGVPLGILAATHHHKMTDRVATFISMLGVSMPPFWLAILLVLFFSFKLDLLPTFGIGGLRYYILPALANCFQGVTGFARQTRSSILENIRADYVSTARAKGISEIRVLWSHIMPNSMIPIVTFAGAQFNRLLAGAVVIENVFSLSGIGNYVVTAINMRDYNAVQGTIIYLAIIAAVIMLLVDVVYAYINPRIKARFESKSRRKQHA